jgi:hypothetical protein
MTECKKLLRAAGTFQQAVAVMCYTLNPDNVVTQVEQYDDWEQAKRANHESQITVIMDCYTVEAHLIGEKVHLDACLMRLNDPSLN